LALESKVLVSQPEARGRDLTPDVAQAWRWVGWFSLVLTLAGVGDWVLAWVPMRLGSPEWEFGTVASTFSGLPLATMGFAGLLGSAVARGIRWQVRVVGVLLLMWAALILGAFVLFLLDIPVALGAVQPGPARLGIVKAIAKTVMLVTLFSVAYLVGGIGALRRSSRG
jgi:hypothetical protein